LQDLASGVTIEDWSKANWWTKYKDPYEVVPHLFPGPAELHANYHASAYFDYLAGEKRHLLVSWGDLIEHFPKTMPTNDDEKFGYLMELLLRRQEKLTRTSVLFRLGQTFDQNEPQLCQFVGGTFLGLERPGVPFEETRFHSFADHLRPLVVGLVHFCTTRLVEKRQRQRRQFREDFHKAIEGILRLLEVGLRPDDQSLLYSSDHDKYTGPSRVRVKNLFSPHWSESLNSGGEGPESDCDNVWKSLLEIGDDDTCKTLEQFLSDPISDPMMSRKKIKCKECLCDACGYLLGKLWDGPRDLKSKTDIIIGSGITLPSRPGIRFLMCVCDFIVATEADEKRTSRLCRLVIKPGELEMEFTDYEIVKAIREYNFAPRGPTTRGPKEEAFHLESRFRAFRKCAPPISSDGEWGRFLTMREFAGGYRIVTSNTQPKLLLRWSPLL
jgi:hypothetical protein